VNQFKEIQIEVIKIVASVTKNSTVDENSNQINCSGWDSLGYLVIIAEIESNFKVSIGADFFDKMNSIKNISNFLYDKLIRKDY
jgi:acyl carrier protein